MDPQVERALAAAQAEQGTYAIVYLLIGLACWLVWGFAAMAVGSKAGRGGEGLAFGLIFGPIGVAAAYLSVCEWRLEKLHKLLAETAGHAGVPAGNAAPSVAPIGGKSPPGRPLKPSDPDDEFLKQIGVGQ